MLQSTQITGYPTHDLFKPFGDVYCKKRAKLIRTDEKIIKNYIRAE